MDIQRFRIWRVAHIMLFIKLRRSYNVIDRSVYINDQLYGAWIYYDKIIHIQTTHLSGRGPYIDIHVCVIEIISLRRSIDLFWHN